jgi:hypothetical protein
MERLPTPAVTDELQLNKYKCVSFATIFKTKQLYIIHTVTENYNTYWQYQYGTISVILISEKVHTMLQPRRPTLPYFYQ